MYRALAQRTSTTRADAGLLLGSKALVSLDGRKGGIVTITRRAPL
ncbi:MAG: hypothetical protein AAF841_11750 [Pseudomonadota bacterium]